MKKVYGFILMSTLLTMCSSCASGADDAVTPLKVVQIDTPRATTTTEVEESGTYFKVLTSSSALGSVNAALQAAVRSEEDRFLTAVNKAEPIRGPSVFKTTFVREYLSASTAVVSELLPISETLGPGGTGESWIATTVSVPSGRKLDIFDSMFSSSSIGLRLIAASVRHQIMNGVSSQDECVRQSQANLPEFAAGFDPTMSNFTYLSMTTKGLAVGIPQEQIGGDACGGIEVTVSYAAVRSALSSEGRKLIGELRSPK
jgi:hypothetical protein